MRRQPIEDKLFGTVTVRQDGRAVHDMYTFRVKAPHEFEVTLGRLTQLLARIPGDRGVPAAGPRRLHAG